MPGPGSSSFWIWSVKTRRSAEIPVKTGAEIPAKISAKIPTPTGAENSREIENGKARVSMAWITAAEEFLYELVQVCTMLMEMLGIFVLVSTAVRCFYKWLRKEGGVRLTLAQGIALALEFKMGGEVLRTVVVREWAELGILGAIIVLRGLLTFLIHWEIRNEETAIEKEKSSGSGGEP